MASLTPPYRVKALYDYSSPHDDDLSFQANQIISVTAEEDDDWSYGKYTDNAGVEQEGIFPRNYVEVIPEEVPPAVPPPPPRPAAKTAPPPAPAPAAEPPAATTETAHTKPVKRISMSEYDDRSPVQEKTKKELQQSFSPPPVPKAAPEPERATQPKPPPPASSAPKPSAPKPPVPVTKANPVVRRQSGSETSQQQQMPRGGAGKNDDDSPAKPVGSFRDRIAAFNKPAAAPVGPFQGAKPPSGFIKKPYVPPPPSKNAYIPPPPAIQPAIVHRNEDARPPPPADESSAGGGGGGADDAASEEKPSVSSLKDRIALLQSMQLNPMGGAAKPKKPPKPAPKPKEHAAPKSSMEVADEANIHSDTTSEGPEARKRSGAGVSKKTEAGMQPLGYQSGDADEEEAGDVSEGDLSKDEGPPLEKRVTRDEAERTVEERDAEEEEAEGDEEEEEEIDPEVARRLAIRERMMKMSGGMGMYGMMAAPPPPPPAKKKKAPKPPAEGETAHDDGAVADMTARPGDVSPGAMQARIPIFPGMLPTPKAKEPEAVPEERSESPEQEQDEGEAEGAEHVQPSAPEIPASTKPAVRRPSQGPGSGKPVVEADAPPRDDDFDDSGSTPPLPSTAPPPRPSVRPPRRQSTDGPPAVQSPQIPRADVVATATEGSESDDELSVRGGSVLSLSSIPPPPPARDSPSMAQDIGMDSPQTASNRRSIHGASPPGPGSPLSPGGGKRTSYVNRQGGIPPIPGAVSPSFQSSPSFRPPPPPIPGSSPLPSTTTPVSARAPQSAFRYDADEEVTEYEADYDTDLASGEAHKDALKAHGQDHGRHHKADDDEDGGNTALPSPSTEEPAAPFSLETHVQGMGRPPSPPRPTRTSVDVPRGPPPPPPSAPPLPKSLESHPEEQTPRSPPKIEHTPISPTGSPVVHRASEDAFGDSSGDRRNTGTFRRSTDMPRPSMEHSYVAQDVDLALSTQWWKHPNTPPPVFQNRQRDLTFEIEDTSTSRRGGRGTITRDVYVLFHDYSQTIVTARYEKDDPANATVEQKHEQPPLSLRQDQLEALSGNFGETIVKASQGHQNTVVGDGTAFALVSEVFKSIPGALSPAGTRSFGALAYSNLGNATIQQFDEIRPGDIITFRNARFQGHKGGLHQKYSLEVGGKSSGDHVAVVLEWDGTKKKVKVLEQGRENKKVKSESFKLGDLKSGEVKVWRVVGRGWVGWEAQG